MAAPIGNTNAKKAKAWSDAIHKHLVQNPQDLAEIAKSLVTQAKEGNLGAIKELGDRIDGKSIQGIEGQLEHSLIVEITKFSE